MFSQVTKQNMAMISTVLDHKQLCSSSCNESPLYSLISLPAILFLLMILNSLIIIKDFIATFRLVHLTLVHFISAVTKFWANKSSNNVVDDDGKMSRLQVEQVMERLGMSCRDDELPERVGTDEVGRVFEEEEEGLRVEEVKRAFEVFDDNRDGFIDAMELNKVLCALGFDDTCSSLEGCDKMIGAYDDNKDGRIDFHEFVKLLEGSLCF